MITIFKRKLKQNVIQKLKISIKNIFNKIKGDILNIKPKRNKINMKRNGNSIFLKAEQKLKEKHGNSVTAHRVDFANYVISLNGFSYPAELDTQRAELQVNWKRRTKIEG